MRRHFYLNVCHVMHLLNIPSPKPRIAGTSKADLLALQDITGRPRSQFSFQHGGWYEHKNAISLVKGQNGPDRSAVQLAQHGIRAIP